MELGFYHADLEDNEAFSALLDAAIAEGMYPTGELRTWPARHRFASIVDEPAQLIDVAPDRVEHATRREVPFVLQVKLNGIFPDESLLTYGSISRRAMLTDHHPIALWTSGADLAYEPVEDVSVEEALGAFLHLVARTEPAYAAITIDYPLDCPADLAQRDDCDAFSDFYLSRSFIPDSVFVAILESFSGAYVKEIGNGAYISCTPLFNPEGTAFPDWPPMSRKVAGMIGRVGGS